MPTGTSPCGWPASHRVSHSRGALLDGHVQLPAELADVGDPRREHHDAADLDLPAGAEREPRVRHVVGGHRGQHVPGPRAPQPDRGPGRGEVGQGRPGGQVVGDPLGVGHPGRAAGHHPEPVRAQPHHGQVGPEAAVLVQPRGVHHARRRPRSAGRPTGSAPHPARPGPEISSTAKADRSTRAQRVPHGQVLGVDDRRPPARLPLGRALHQPARVPLQQGGVGGVPERPLPADGLVEEGAERAFPVVEPG